MIVLKPEESPKEAPSERGKKKGGCSTCVIIAVVGLFLLFFGPRFFLMFFGRLFHRPTRKRPYSRRRRTNIHQKRLNQCKTNMKNVGTALEMYATDNSGHYPSALTDLTPNYLSKIPHCPASGKKTYEHTYVSSTKPDAYTFYCSGPAHSQAGIRKDFPQYDSVSGLRVK